LPFPVPELSIPKVNATSLPNITNATINTIIDAIGSIINNVSNETGLGNVVPSVPEIPGKVGNDILNDTGDYIHAASHSTMLSGSPLLLMLVFAWMFIA
jgi:hypothetical protein